MNLKVLIAEAQEVLRVGLRSILTSDTRVLEVYEAASEKELHRSLLSDKPDLIVVNQDLLADISILQTENFVMLAMEPKIAKLKAAYEYGARGYLSVDASAELLRTVLRLTKKTFLIEPTLAPALMEYVFERRVFPTLDETLLTSREREIVCLLREGYDRSSVARELCIAETTLKTHIKNIAKKHTTEMYSSRK